MRCIKIVHWIFIRNFRVNSTTCFTTTQEGRGTWISFLHFSFFYEKYCYDLELYPYPEIKSHELCTTSGYDKVDEFLKAKVTLHVWGIVNTVIICHVEVHSVEARMLPSPEFCLNSPETHRHKGTTALWEGKNKPYLLWIFIGRSFYLYGPWEN